MHFVEQQPGKKLPIHHSYLEVRRILAEQRARFEGDEAADRALKALDADAPPVDEVPMAVPAKPTREPKPSTPVARSAAGANAPPTKPALPAKRLAAN
jgi:hypothetical protein